MEQPRVLSFTPSQAPRITRQKRLTRSATVHPAGIFIPEDPSLSPEAHFPLQTVSAPDRPALPRFVNRFNSREMLLVIDGSCINNGRSFAENNPGLRPSGGIAFKFKGGSANSTTEAPTFPLLVPTEEGHEKIKDTLGTVKHPLEYQGPQGHIVDHTSNRAKLRAVIAALQFRSWGQEGWRRVVILTDLEYIVRGATEWLPRWVRQGWRKTRLQPWHRRRRGEKFGPKKPGASRYAIANRDLWEELQFRIEELRRENCEVSFWLACTDVERESQFIAQTKAAAREAAGLGHFWDMQPERFTQLCGIML
ncbi:ribonuclease H [Podospora australis]|uniref:Ribonuclease H n=1 Tax=Podospora australis TaxID=1536484 RepID=A0AAN6WQE0_9PEZI|nr:ribonuclease H [Podospora australis]